MADESADAIAWLEAKFVEQHPNAGRLDKLLARIERETTAWNEVRGPGQSTARADWNGHREGYRDLDPDAWRRARPPTAAEIAEVEASIAAFKADPAAWAAARRREAGHA